MRKSFVLLTNLGLLLLASCAADIEQSVNSDGSVFNQESLSMEVIEDAPSSTLAPLDNPRQFLADLLYEGLQALDSDRLLTPVDDNAHARFKRVLAYEPDNQIAIEGLQSIVARYLQLAEQSMRRGLFDESLAFIDNARFVDSDDPRITPVWTALQAEMNSGDLFFTLDNKEFSERSAQAIEKLQDIAKQAQQTNAFFLITAPNDELGRWMFLIMRDSVPGYRLRGNIELARQTSIRLRLPKTSAE